jgi:hypothetical protein
MKVRILPFDPFYPGAADRQVGRLCRDGSIRFRGRRYATIKDLPPECTALHLDAETHRQWRQLYRAVDPRRRRSSQPARPG